MIAHVATALVSLVVGFYGGAHFVGRALVRAACGNCGSRATKARGKARICVGCGVRRRN